MKIKFASHRQYDGNKKTVRRFAILPKIVDNGNTLVWMEYYFKDYVWRAWNSPRLNDGWELKKVYSKDEKNRIVEQILSK